MQKWNQFDFRSRPRWGSSERSPRPPAVFKGRGPTSKGKKGEGKGKGKKGEGKGSGGLWIRQWKREGKKEGQGGELRLAGS